MREMFAIGRKALSVTRCHTAARIFAATACSLMLYACGGGGGSESQPPAPTVSLDEIRSGSAQLATANPSAPFTGLPLGVPAVSVSSPPVVNFVIKTTDGRIVTGLTTNEVRAAIAKLIPEDSGGNGTGDTDRWVNYVYRLRTGTAFPDGAWQATTETAASLTYNAEGGYYSLQFTTDITTAVEPNTGELIWDPAATHRIALQVQIRKSDTDRTTVAVSNPYFDFTFNAVGNSQAVSADKTRKVVDKSACNECHNKLAAHGGGRVDPQYCVLCHNPSTTDPVTGNVVDFTVMVHKIHKGRALATPYVIGTDDFSDIGFPQDLRNCTKCHSGDKTDAQGNLLTLQGDNWMEIPTQQACQSCHESVDFNDHEGFDFIADDGAEDNSLCASCHVSRNGPLNIANTHWNQAEINAQNYQFNIEDVTYDALSRQITVDYSVTNPNAGGSAYDLTADCTGDCVSGNKFYNLRIYAGTLNLIGAPNNIADYTGTVNDRAVFGTDLGGHHYRLSLPVLADTSAEFAHGTARVVSTGQVLEELITNQNSGQTDPSVIVNIPVQNAYQEIALDGALQPRRMVVSTAKCNACHSTLGTATGSNTLANAFHSGGRNTVEACVVCHNAYRTSTTLMTDPNGDVLPVFPETSIFAGRTFNQSFDFKNMIHGIHGGERRSAPFTHGNPPGEVENFTELVAYPGILADCTTCHEGDSYRNDRSPLGTSVLSLSTSASNPNLDLLEFIKNSDGLVDPLQVPVFSQRAASCVGCHDTAANRLHMQEQGGSAFDMNQADVALDGKVFERCDECHGITSLLPIDQAHKL